MKILSAILLAVAIGAPSAALAEDIALAKNSMRLYGGPDMVVPHIGLIAWGLGLKVMGCERDTGWCEGIAGGQRGWLPSESMDWPGPGRSPVLCMSGHVGRLVTLSGGSV